MLVIVSQHHQFSDNESPFIKGLFLTTDLLHDACFLVFFMVAFYHQLWRICQKEIQNRLDKILN
jgi:hypothetical protein